MASTKSNEMSPEEMEQFSEKLEQWSGTLSDNERTLLKHMLELRRSDEVTGFALNAAEFQRVSFRPFTYQAVAPTLSANFFRLMCW